MKPSLQSPLLPGIWDVRLIKNGTVWARVQFLISPLEIMSGVPITQQQTGYVTLKYQNILLFFFFKVLKLIISLI